MVEEKMIEEKKLNKHDFYFETSLYELVKINSFSEDIFSGEVDAYSSTNGIETTYEISHNAEKDLNVQDGRAKYRSNIFSFSGFLTINLKCKRKETDVLRFFLLVDGEYLIKVGQRPSLADMQFAELGKRYDKILPTDDLKNLKKAIGLYAHGAGAGSFVYLRRIFENLVFQSFEGNIDSLDISLEDFNKKRMEDKVEVLKDLLPSQLVAMKKIYSILSKGVHELSEEDCLKYFRPMKLSIELILDQKIEMLQKREKDIKAKSIIDSISKDLL